ncbi:hypothetical protein PPTG_16253 [Phytophthora nicotianae INRA-310]|uniref:START domain-containing protein n=2 Tax=Phytophthora nicotianae TaxID=4792 RepID=W2PPU4_PHYN3|nr:hypothetical protein PPTG_16253 [Phytophthora nicotianae INRA-310]ETN02651.1 hypothetical protein PPTG_16253 [Phytophthora nicotianae INRA-310]KUF91026.1 hypothetical protein AM587_10005467 [Phytophthora nicotianae]
MSKFLHTATHLPTDSQSRLRYLESVCTEAKLDIATQILLSETESTRLFTVPSFSWEPLDVGPSGFGVTSIAVFAIDSSNACETFQAARTAIGNCAVVWPNYSLLDSSVNQMDMQSVKFNIHYGVTEHRFQSGMSEEQVVLESRDLSYFRVGGEGSVFLWDFVDEDNQFPVKKTTAVKRSTVVALLVRPERCDDGVERVVCRYICSKIHMIDALELPPGIERFSKSKQLGAQVADSMVYETIKGDVARNSV